MNLIITNAGLAAITNAENNGTLPLTIAEVALGSGLWTPDATATGLQNEIKRISTVTGGNPAPDQLYAEILDDSSDTYTLGEIGFYWSDGTLLAIYSQTSPIQDKTATVPLLLSCDIALSSLPVNSLTFGDTNFQYPPATETVKGVAEIATQDEANGSTDDSRILTAKKLHNRIATESQRGVIEIATQGTVNAGTDQYRAVTPKTLSNSTATETRRGVAEIATQEEVDGETDDSRIITAKKLASRLASWAGNLFKSAAYKDAGDADGKVALIGDPTLPGNTAVVVATGSNANGEYIIYSDGLKIATGKALVSTASGTYGSTAQVPLPINFDSVPYFRMAGISGAQFSTTSHPIGRVETLTQSTITLTSHYISSACHVSYIAIGY